MHESGQTYVWIQQSVPYLNLQWEPMKWEFINVIKIQYDLAKLLAKNTAQDICTRVTVYAPNGWVGALKRMELEWSTHMLSAIVCTKLAWASSVSGGASLDACSKKRVSHLHSPSANTSLNEVAISPVTERTWHIDSMGWDNSSDYKKCQFNNHQFFKVRRQ